MTGASSRRKGRVGVRTDFGRPLSHGHCVRRKESPTYKTWMMMRTRCNNPNYDGFAEYGGRGIRVCDRWESFENFLADMGERPGGMSIDRIDPDGGYSPDNCRWASHLEQVKNRRPKLVREINGEHLTTAAAIEKYGASGVTKDCVE